MLKMPIIKEVEKSYLYVVLVCGTKMDIKSKYHFFFHLGLFCICNMTYLKVLT